MVSHQGTIHPDIRYTPRPVSTEKSQHVPRTRTASMDASMDARGHAMPMVHKRGAGPASQPRALPSGDALSASRRRGIIASSHHRIIAHTYTLCFQGRSHTLGAQPARQRLHGGSFAYSGTPAHAIGAVPAWCWVRRLMYCPSRYLRGFQVRLCLLASSTLCTRQPMMSSHSGGGGGARLAAVAGLYVGNGIKGWQESGVRSR